MDDDDGREEFAINDTDLDFAMNPGRNRRHQTKEQAALGIWADDDSDDDGSARPSFGRKRPNYNTPVNFVSGGVAVGNKVVDGAEDQKPGTSKEEEAPIEINFKRAKPESKKQQQRPQMGANVFAGMRTSASKATVDDATMEKWLFSSGKGDKIMNMMKGMGWSLGEGLGKERQGIVEPIQTKLRPGRGAVGAYGKEVNSSGPRFGETAADAQKRLAGEKVDDKQPQAQTIPKGSWKKSAKIKTVYKTMDDVIKEGGGPVRVFRGTGVSKVIDMTGPEQRVYSGYDAFSLKTKVEIDEPRETFDVPELSHNINLLLDLTEEDIRRTNHQLGVLKDQTIALEHDYQRAKEEGDKAENEYSRMKQIYELLSNFSEKKSPSMNECQALFNRLRTEFPIEYQLLHLEGAAIPIVLPLIVSFFARWRPLDPDHSIYGIDLMREWKDVLRETDTRMFATQAATFDKLPAFDRLLWDGWMPSIRRAVRQLIHVIQTWLPLLPNWMKENILDRVIVPKIEAEVEQWNPLKDEVPVHLWILPWLDIMGDRLVPVFSPIRQHLAKALRLWNPLDQGALVMLRPWKGVWTQATMSAFCSTNIIPALDKCLANVNLDPTTNKLCPEFDAVLNWREIINEDMIVNVLTRNFFPRWYAQICAWLDSSPGNPAVVNDVSRWYKDWKERVPFDLVKRFPVLENEMKRAMIAIHNSSQGRIIGAGTPLQPVLSNVPPPPPPPPRPQHIPPPQPAVQLTIRETLEREAGHHGLTFVPQTNRLRDGNQVFWFGSQSVYVCAGVIYHYDTTNFDWYPITISRLLQYNGI
ncbi:unnamed protein product, partial [Mesorhabditis belari]|uniref:G-patch domain-containing protein n=1 Tax=Mesorhabditis belari TaxID=2138241 RepID=A0AAF3F4C4_9BILA